MYSSVVVEVGVGGAILVFVAFSSAVTVAKGVEGSDDTSSEFMVGNNSALSSTSFNFALAVSFSSLKNYDKICREIICFIINYSNQINYLQSRWTTFGKKA